MSATTDRSTHWEAVYSSKSDVQVSWYEDEPVSLKLFDEAGIPEAARVIDIGGGRSTLADRLLARGSSHVTVLDLSQSALDAVAARNHHRPELSLVVADVTIWEPVTRYDVWHDRAVLHFLTAEADKVDYVATLRKALRPGGTVIIGTFAPDGPERCSGLPVQRHDSASLRALLGDAFELIHSRRHDHFTPWKAVQHFQFSTFVFRPA